MHRIDTSTAQIDKFGHGKNGFTNGDPATGRRATDLNSDMWDAVQEEICAVIESSGMALNKEQHNQLYKAIISTVTSKIPDALIRNKNLSDLVDKAIARTNLGLGELAVKGIGYIYDSIYPIGVVTWFAQNKNPNTLFPGTKWNYIGENRTIRLASANGSDVMATGGSDSVKLAVGNLPAHGHAFSANTSGFDHGTKTTSGFDYGTKTTSSTGNHRHRSGTEGTLNGGGGHTTVPQLSGGTATYTDSVGNHTHTVALGSHSHTVGIGAHSHSVSGTTANSGSGTAVNVTNSFIKLMGWYRSA